MCILTKIVNKRSCYAAFNREFIDILCDNIRFLLPKLKLYVLITSINHAINQSPANVGYIVEHIIVVQDCGTIDWSTYMIPNTFETDSNCAKVYNLHTSYWLMRWITYNSSNQPISDYNPKPR